MGEKKITTRKLFPLDPSLSLWERANAYTQHSLKWKGEEFYGRRVSGTFKFVDVKLRDEKDPDKSAPLSSVSFELDVTSELCTPDGILHGGAVALIFDMATSSTINAASKPGFWDSGSSSRTLTCSYLRPVKVNETVRIDCEVVSLGKRNALLRGVMRQKGSNGEKGEVCYTCEHDKINVVRPPKL